jgi:hypothetical protein
MDIVDKARQSIEQFKRGELGVADQLIAIDRLSQAADEIARLRAEVEALRGAMEEASKQMDGFIHLANHVGINDADGFYLAAALDAKKILDAAIDAARGKDNG